ncbi:MAG: hypothetical protein NWF07_06030 [Candidatus Bathyarchaeota archaeon]|nr:hypothetical protein [Candidatus Bathyarchaeota archaeon]
MRKHTGFISMIEKIKEKRQYIFLGLLLVLITAGNYYLNGGAKANWVEATGYGFTMLHPPGITPWTTGLDEENVFDLYGNYQASSMSGMMGFNFDNKEFGVTWVTMEDVTSLETLLDIHYHSAEVNADKRDRGFNIELEPIIESTLNGHEAVYQIHILELDMPGEDKLLYAKGAAAGWTCEETGVSYVSYLLMWNWGSPPRVSASGAIDALNQYLDTFECH